MFIGLFFSSFQGKKLPCSLGADAEEGEVSEEDSADEIEDDCKLKPCFVGAHSHFPECDSSAFLTCTLHVLLTVVSRALHS